MKLRKSVSAVAAAALAVAWAGAARATVDFLDVFAPQQTGWDYTGVTDGYLGPLNNHVNVSGVSLGWAPGVNIAGVTLGFRLLGFDTLDGLICCTDTLSVAVDGVTLLSGTFGVGNAQQVYIAPAGLSVDFLGAVGPLGQQGHASAVYDIAFQIPDLTAGMHTFAWSYTPLQSLADESWGLDNVVIQHQTPVGEPNMVALLGVGMVGLGALIRRKTKTE
ncbi:MAG: hypothetical protein KDC18_02210 [Alphaproteobacteria bacterium]|nr:hypothetical protein [Alphaproteobacteria bacterium]MCB9930559.1 hypothetical protein [Alphaproteobacteria bacterium]